MTFPLSPSLSPFSGCLVGQAVGDALGFIVEGMPGEVCERLCELALRERQLEGLARGEFALGQYSDDTQLARELACSLVAREGLDPADYGQRIAAIFVEDRIVGRGRATLNAALRLANGVPWDEAGEAAPSAGNGSAMRAAPIGLVFAHDPGQLCRAAHDQGRITHRDPRCSAGAIAIAGATALALGDVEPKAFCAQLAAWTEAFDPILARGLVGLPETLGFAPAMIAPVIARVGLAVDHDDDWPGISPFVTPSVLWSVYAFLRTPKDFVAAIDTAIAVGGDVDTTAAMTGAIAGAHVGLGGIPEDFACLVNDRGTWGRAELCALAVDLQALQARLAAS